jgi:hypothetical protein
VSENKTDGYHAGLSRLKTYNSYIGNTSTRLEVHDCITVFVKVNHLSISHTLRMDRNELLTMREVLNMWFEENEKIK